MSISRCVVWARKVLKPQILICSLWSQMGKTVRKKKNVVTKFRTSSYEKKIIKLRAKKVGLSQSEFCKRAVLEIKITERLTEEQIDLYKMLVQYHNNFKSIGNLIKTKHPSLYEKVYQVAEDIKNHLQNFKK